MSTANHKFVSDLDILTQQQMERQQDSGITKGMSNNIAADIAAAKEVPHNQLSAAEQEFAANEEHLAAPAAVSPSSSMSPSSSSRQKEHHQRTGLVAGLGHKLSAAASGLKGIITGRHSNSPSPTHHDEEEKPIENIQQQQQQEQQLPSSEINAFMNNTAATHRSAGWREEPKIFQQPEKNAGLISEGEANIVQVAGKWPSEAPTSEIKAWREGAPWPSEREWGSAKRE